MKLPGLIAFTACLFVFAPAMGQSSQSPNPQTPKASQVSPAPEVSQRSQTGFIRNPFVQQPQGAGSADQKLILQRKALLDELALQQKALDELTRRRTMTRDPGIFVRNAGNICGAIVSYNFSQGAAPRLENVTTCTSSGKVKMRQAQDEHAKPSGPRLLLK